MGMSSLLRLGSLTPNAATREGRMLGAGSLIATVTSKRTGQHVTLRLRATAKRERAPRWPTMPWERATHVFVEGYDHESIGKYRRADGILYFERFATPAERWATTATLRFVCDDLPLFETQAVLSAADICGACGRELTSPESLERGLGPECWRAAVYA